MEGAMPTAHIIRTVSSRQWLQQSYIPVFAKGVSKNAKSHGVSLPDALVAATAEGKGATLVTLNQTIAPRLLDLL
jgi:predicted nucleic acid-binding protein